MAHPLEFPAMMRAPITVLVAGPYWTPVNLPLKVHCVALRSAAPIHPLCEGGWGLLKRARSLNGCVSCLRSETEEAID